MSECPRCFAKMENDTCVFCKQQDSFAEFAQTHRLTHYPDPDGDRYLHPTKGDGIRKKGEYPEYMDELWNALVKATGSDDTLLIH